ncbi:hypothetical protein HERIO_585 [Hepatospora eriocheir]|uniref:Uncharacterized protein n=1 Tax=Hepatospora eriocheir TaxID=1081669 RepID=A0A1X0QD17_9MICR|nr:hypothetical protein HERIO_585 [Hepatospora eriocheir]
MNKQIEENKNDINELKKLLPFCETEDVVEILKLTKYNKDRFELHALIREEFSHSGLVIRLLDDFSDSNNKISLIELSKLTSKIDDEQFIKSIKNLSKNDLRFLIKKLKFNKSLNLYKNLIYSEFASDEFVRIRLFEFNYNNLMGWLRTNQYIFDYQNQVYIISLIKKFKKRLNLSEFKELSKQMIKSNNCSRRHFGLMIYFEVSDIIEDFIFRLTEDINSEIRNLVVSKIELLDESNEKLLENLKSIDTRISEGAAMKIINVLTKENTEKFKSELEKEIKNHLFEYPGYMYFMIKYSSSNTDMYQMLSDYLLSELDLQKFNQLKLKIQIYLIEYLIKNFHNNEKVKFMIYKIFLECNNYGLIINLRQIMRNRMSVDIAYGFEYLINNVKSNSIVFRKGGGISSYFTLTDDYLTVVIECVRNLVGEYNELLEYHLLNILEALLVSKRIVGVVKFVSNKNSNDGIFIKKEVKNYLKEIIIDDTCQIIDIFTLIAFKSLKSNSFLIKNCGLSIFTCLLKNKRSTFYSNEIRRFIFKEREDLKYYVLMIYDEIFNLNEYEIDFIKKVSLEKSIEGIKAKNIISRESNNFDDNIDIELVILKDNPSIIYSCLIEVLNSDYLKERNTAIDYFNKNLADGNLVIFEEECRIRISDLIKKLKIEKEVVKKLIKLKENQMVYSYSDFQYDVNLLN